MSLQILKTNKSHRFVNLSVTESDLLNLYNENYKRFITKFAVYHLGTAVLQKLSFFHKTIDSNLKTIKFQKALPNNTFSWTMDDFKERHNEKNWKNMLQISNSYSADILDVKKLSSELKNIKICIKSLLDNYLLRQDKENKLKVDKMLNGAALLDDIHIILRKEAAERAIQCGKHKFALDELDLKYNLADVRIRGLEKQLLDKLEVREPCITRYVLTNIGAEDEDHILTLQEAEIKLRQEIKNLNQKITREIINHTSTLDMYNITCSNLTERLSSFEKKFTHNYDEYDRIHDSLTFKINEIHNNCKHLNDIKEFYRKRIKEVQENNAVQSVLTP